jgi:DNA-binding FadR family transcriptional regulator
MEFEQTTASRSPERLIRQPKMAEVVADLLRSKILTGRLADGELLPRQEVLMAELGASRDVLRQGLQILEAEGLVKVRRGNVGGVEVHRPSDSNAAHMVALVLESAGTTLDDIARTLLYLEVRPPQNGRSVPAKCTETGSTKR